MKSIYYNPYEKLTEIQLLLIGLTLGSLGCLLGFYLDARFDGVVDMHTAGKNTVTLQQPFIDNAINTIILFIVLYLLALFINKKTRAIDILNVALIARAPIYLATLINIGGILDSLANLDPSHTSNISIGASVMALVAVVIILILGVGSLIWFIALLYHGFKTATNLKLTKQKVALGFTVLLAEIIAKLLIGYLNY